MNTVGQHNGPSVPGPALDLTTIGRAVATVAIGMVHTVERAMAGPEQRIRTARGNAWEAICADRARAVRRDEIRRTVAELTAARTATSGPASGSPSSAPGVSRRSDPRPGPARPRLR